MPVIANDETILLVAAIATFAVPAGLLIAAILAAVRRSRGIEPGPRTAAAIAFLTGASLGTLLLFGIDMSPVVWGPLVIAMAGLLLHRWRRGRREQAGWLLIGAGLPLGLPALLLFDDAASAVLDYPWTAAAGVAAIAGVGLVLRGDPAPAAPDRKAPAGQPGSRSIATIAEAIRGPTLIGPLPQPELAMLATFVVILFVVPLLTATWQPPLLRVVLPAILAAVLGTEAYVRGMPGRSRRAFEAFSWLGEWELARAHEATGEGVPTSKDHADAWLERNPERPEVLPVRIEVLLFAERYREAQDALSRLPTDAPWARFELEALRDLVDWRAGGDGDLEAMAAAAEEIRPVDGDDRLRAEVTIAVAKVRRLMADGRSEPGAAIEPLLDVRKRLGRRADGQVGRALRRRLIPVLLIPGVLLSILAEVFVGHAVPV